MTTLQEMLAAAPGAFDPAFVAQAADLAEDTPGYENTAYALRWLASRRLWPLCRDDIARWRWAWLRASVGRSSGQPITQRLRKAVPHAVLPRLVFDLFPRSGAGVWMLQYHSARDAVVSLAKALRSLRDLVEVRP